MKLFSFIALLLVVLMPFGQAKESDTEQRKQVKRKTAKNISKDARELPYFRLPWMDKNYDRWSHTKIKRSKLSAEQIKALPSRVDNSSNKAWQGIGNQGKKNCCSQEGTVAGMLSYEINAYRNSDGSKPENCLPTHFSWNFFNRSKNNGAEMIHGLETAYTVGIPSQKTYGGRYNSIIGYWPNGYHVWHDAMKNRIAGYDFIKVNTVEKLQFAKAWLHNHAGWFNSNGGGMLTIDGTDVWGSPVKKIPKEAHEAGKHIWTDWGSKYGGHVMCVVGYDDQVAFDVNKDGKITNDVDINNDGEITIADYERGAFIVANSWGKKWADKGKVYVLYRCLMSRSSFWDRGPFMGYVVPITRQPRATVRLKAVHNKRDRLKLELAITDRHNKRYALSPNVMFQFSGSVPLGGPGTENKDFEWGLDLTTLAEQAGDNFEQVLKDLQLGKAKLEINFSERKSKKKIDTQGKIKEVELMFWNTDGKKISSKTLLSKEKALKEPFKINYPL
jgi:hypothetical protein